MGVIETRYIYAQDMHKKILMIKCGSLWFHLQLLFRGVLVSLLDGFRATSKHLCFKFQAVDK